MFGLIVSGRLVQTNFEQVGQTQFITVIQEADNINHIVVFLTGTQPFPDGLGGSVYFSWPEQSTCSWHLLGYITNEKPSAIFKISGLKIGGGNSSQNLFANQPAHQAQVGISVEPLSQVTSLTPASSTEPSSLDFYMEFSKAICENIYNYVASFAKSPDQIVPNPGEQYLPISLISKWYENFIRRLQQNPNFWKK